MLNQEQRDYVQSLKKTHPNLDKEVLREAMLESKWTEIEIMEAISLYNTNDTVTEESNSEAEKGTIENSNKGNSKETETTKSEKTNESQESEEEVPILIKERTLKSRIISMVTNILIVVLFLVLIVVGGLVFFQVSLAEVQEFINSDIFTRISNKMLELKP